MLSWLRQHRYALGMTLRRLRVQPFSSLSNLLVLALVLAVPVLGGAVLVSVQPLVREVAVAPEMSLFLRLPDSGRAESGHADAGRDKAAAQAVARRIRSDFAAEVQSVRVVTREAALAQLRRNRDWEDALAVLPDNPLPDAVVVRLSAGADLAARAARLARAWQAWVEVERVQLDSVWVQRLDALLRAAQAALGFLLVGMALVVLATVFNTVRMQALAQREEIAVARLVGATEAFVRRPFLYLGALSGALAALLALGLAALALLPLNQALAALAASYGTVFALHLPNAGLLALGVLAVATLGAVSARWSVTRTTRF